MAGKGKITIFKEIANSGLPKIRIQLPTHTIANPREFVLESIGNNQFYPHFRIWDGDHIMGNISSSDKNLLFDKMYDVLPLGAELMVPRSSMDYLATQGTVGAYTRFAGDSRYVAGTPGSFLYRDKDDGIKTFNTTSFFKPRTSHVQGAEAVLMFKDYGGEAWPEGSINGEQLMKYVPEVRERYGLVGNTDITDEEIAQALYKHVKELGGNTAAVNALGEPQLLFRGDTKDYTMLRDNHANAGGTEDNILGTLFLGSLPSGKEDMGIYRYLVRGLNYESPYEVAGAGAGAGVWPIVNGKVITGATEGILGVPVANFPAGTRPVILYHTRRMGDYLVFKLPGSATTSGVNDVNAFVVRTPNVRDITNQVVVASGGEGPIPEFEWLLPKEDRIGKSLHDIRLQLNQAVVLLAQENSLGLLKSNKGSYWRGDEHGKYDYFALPDFNVLGAKHILPYDLRIPRDWNSKNIFRSLALPAIAGAGLTYYINSNGSNDK